MEHLVGKRVELIEMPDDPAPIKKGEKGTILSVQGSTALLYVDWDNGSKLNLIHGVDKYKIIE